MKTYSTEELLEMYKGWYAQERKKFVDLVRLLQTVGNIEVDEQLIPFRSADWNTSEDGRLFPFVVFERTDIPVLERRESPRWSGHLCPNCFGRDVVMTENQPEGMTSDRASASEMQSWKCNSCGDTWKYKHVWLLD